MRIAIIIPTLNEERALPLTLEIISGALPGATVIVADGGSRDQTRLAAEQFASDSIVWLEVEPGRGSQMNAGAARACEDILLFLHADTHLPATAGQLIASALQDPEVIGGFFKISFQPVTRFTSFYAWLYNVRSLSKICYGDAAIFVRRGIFEALGGFRQALIMEDLDFMMRLRRRGKVHYIKDAAVTTSSRQFATTSRGIKMAAVWLLLPVLFRLGVSQEQLARLYPASR